MKNQSVQQALETKFNDILALNCIPDKFKKDLEKIQKKIPSYFESVFFNQENIKSLIIEVTGLDGWTIKEFNSLKDPCAHKEYCEFIGFENYEAMIGFAEDTIIYEMYRTSFNKDELCGLEIKYGAGHVWLTGSSLGGSSRSFNATQKDFAKKLKEYFKNN